MSGDLAHCVSPYRDSTRALIPAGTCKGMPGDALFTSVHMACIMGNALVLNTVCCVCSDTGSSVFMYEYTYGTLLLLRPYMPTAGMHAPVAYTVDDTTDVHVVSEYVVTWTPDAAPMTGGAGVPWSICHTAGIAAGPIGGPTHENMTEPVGAAVPDVVTDVPVCRHLFVW